VRIPLVAILALVVLWPRVASGQHLRRTDANAQDDLASHGLASDSLCVSKGSSTPGGFDPLPELPGAPKHVVHLAAAAIGSTKRLQPTSDPARWRAGAIAQLHAHAATACHFDATGRVVVGSAGSVGADALAIVHWPGALGGAVHGFFEVAASRDSSAADFLDVPRGVELGVGYTTFNLLELVPFFRSPAPERRARIDLRARLSAGALYEYAGDARRVHGKSIVPEYSVTTGLVVHEVVNSSLLYTARAIPGYIAPTLGSSTMDRTMWEQSVVIDHAVLSNTSSGLGRLEPFFGGRYTWRRLGAADERHELALHVGIHID
jgi:hypothetical protein